MSRFDRIEHTRCFGGASVPSVWLRGLQADRARGGGLLVAGRVKVPRSV